jgi:conjugal transfer ATP-binding protein TraC
MLQIFLGDRKKRHIILFDEAWLALGSFPELLENLARTVRKYNASLILGTQSLNDFYGSNKAASVLENCGWLGVMKQKRESIEMLRSSGRLSLDNARVETIYTLETRVGSYSEIMLSCSAGYVVGRLMLDPYSKILYSTKPSEYGAVKEMIRDGVEGSKAIEIVAEQVYGDEV